MLAPINMQQHARHRPPFFSTPPMLAALLATRHQGRPLQRLLHPGVAQLDGMLLPKLLVEVPDV
jgi:hypothetical protein